MIYTRWGSKVKVIENNGKQRWTLDKPLLTLVKLKFYGGQRYCFRFAEHLKADGGVAEIIKAIEEAPPVLLSVPALVAAMKEAM